MFYKYIGKMTELALKKNTTKMSNYLKQKYIVMNEFSEKNIDDLYLKIRTEHGHRMDSLSFGDLEYINGNSQQHNKNKIIQFVKENPSNYLWKSLETDDYLYLVKDYYRVKKLEVLLQHLNNQNIYYFELSYLENRVKTDKILSTMIDNYDENMEKILTEQEEKINKMNIYIETMEGNIINNDVDIQRIQDKMLQIEQELQIKELQIKELQIKELQIKELQESKIANQLYTIQYIVLIISMIILF